jgi:DNA-directed RNA polymerase specialized sigma24 family protein
MALCGCEGPVTQRPRRVLYRDYPNDDKIGDVKVGMRPASVFANRSALGDLYHLLHHRWREAARAVMVLLSAAGLTADEIGDLPGCHPATVRRWIHGWQRTRECAGSSMANLGPWSRSSSLNSTCR